MSTHLFTEALAREHIRDLRDQASRVQKARRARWGRRAAADATVEPLWRWDPITATFRPADAADAA